MQSYKLVTIIFLLSLFSLNNDSNANKTNDDVIIGADNVMVREKPGLDSKIVTKLRLGEMVRVLKKTEAVININQNKGSWVFVDTHQIKRSTSRSQESSETYKGWVFDYYLYYKHKFTKLKTFNPARLGMSCSGGDMYFEVSFKSDASFDMKDKYLVGSSEEDEKHCKQSHGIYKKSEPRSCYYKGRLFKNNRVIWAKVDNVPDGANYFYYVTDSGQIIYISHGPFYCSTEILK